MFQKFEKVKIQAKQEEHHQKMNLVKKTFYDIEADEKNIELSQNESENIEKYKAIIKKLKAKVKSLQIEIEDINRENYMEKQNHLEDIRDLSKENKLLEGIIHILLQQTEL